MIDSDMETDARPAAAAAPVQDGASSITELRAKLHARIGVLQAKRRAPGITGSNQTPLGARTGVVAGASSAALDDGEADDGESLAGSKDELLEERRRKRGEMRDRRRRERKEARRAAGTPKPDKNAAKLAPGATKGAGATSAPTRAPALLVSDGRHGGAARAGGSGRSDDPSGTDVTFSKLKFAADAHTDKKSRHAMPADPKAALAVLEARKAREAKRAEKLEAKGPDADAEARAKEKKESERWSRAEAAAEGVKLRDDEGLLKKAVKRKEKEKSKSAKEWYVAFAAPAKCSADPCLSPSGATAHATCKRRRSSASRSAPTIWRRARSAQAARRRVERPAVAARRAQRHVLASRARRPLALARAAAAALLDAVDAEAARREAASRQPRRARLFCGLCGHEMRCHFSQACVRALDQRHRRQHQVRRLVSARRALRHRAPRAASASVSGCRSVSASPAWAPA
jgi:hypothetical protein